MQDNSSGWGRKGVRGGEYGRPASGGLSFSITKSVATKHPVDVTYRHTARGCWCRPMLQLHYHRRSDGRTMQCAAGMVVCVGVWGAEGWADTRAGEITLLTAVVKLKFCYQLTLERFVYLFLHLRHFKRHRKRLGVSKVHCCIDR